MMNPVAQLPKLPVLPKIAEIGNRILPRMNADLENCQVCAIPAITAIAEVGQSKVRAIF